MHADFRFHPVGHGLFYSGVINAPNENGEPFVFVYDCGGRRAAKSFERFWKQYSGEKKQLDLLIISHFHRDHISGVLRIIDQARPRWVVLPYLYPEEKIVYVATLLSEFCWGAQKAELSRFVLGPRTYCERGADCRIVFVDRDEMFVRDRVEEQFHEHAVSSDELRFHQGAVLKSSGRHISVRNGAVGLIDQWAFKFFMPKVASNYRDITDWMDEEGIKGEWLDGETNLDEVYEKIRKRFRDPRLRLKQNVSNLACVHGPSMGEHGKQICVITGDRMAFSSRLIVKQHGCGFGCLLPPCASIRQMLTGDAEFGGVSGFDKWMSAEECDQVALFQVPHHGSPQNLEDWFESQLPNCVAWVVPHGGVSIKDRKNVFKVKGTQGGFVYYVKRGLDVCLASVR